MNRLEDGRPNDTLEAPDLRACVQCPALARALFHQQNKQKLAMAQVLSHKMLLQQASEAPHL
eukprot:CAMPEP_0178460880 /NCGR_PEP_ID=MMETSP0689_2-20121128/48978_1 /TAXON_ID=160604 /ORGANISM="Amphidinium massartii, Strain CS-259" /LENGTH=61 /DNA_ID=CAMNT_0020087611 /DNA_START=27 /DNA_END=210 /DNA_ORIENTATION=+